MARALLVDDEPAMRRRIRPILAELGCDVVEAEDGRAALTALAASRFDVVVTDLRMPEVDGLGVLREVRARHRHVPVVVITASGRVADAVAAMKGGATDFVNKPFHEQELRDVLAAAIAAPGGAAPAGAPRLRAPGSVIGDSPAMQELLAQVERVGPSEATVLITGESGTGKEVIARLLHGSSGRAGRPFVPVNCGAIPEGLVESELFGHARGAFTGAIEKRVGRFVQADGGTLFLDEIGELPPPAQAKLLRALQEREVVPVGEARPVPVDIRVVAATHRDLEAMVGEGRFREDLYYRLAVVPIEVPPLRARPRDIPPLARWFLDAANMRNRRAVAIGDAALAAMTGYAFPGNVRELENLIERLVVTNVAGAVTVEDLPAKVRATGPGAAVPADRRAAVPADGIALDQVLRDTEDRLIDEALRQSGGNKARAAQLLGINRTTLIEKLKRRPPRD
jgi:two-component system, NtrC family, response regulator AtoC